MKILKKIFLMLYALSFFTFLLGLGLIAFGNVGGKWFLVPFFTLSLLVIGGYLIFVVYLILEF